MEAPLYRARITRGLYVYRFADDAPYTTHPGGRAIKRIVPGSECRNTGCCDAYDNPIYEHDLVESWHSIKGKGDVYRDVAEMVYVDGVLVKRITGLADTPVPYQYRLDPQKPLRLDHTRILGSTLHSRIKSSRMSTIEFDKMRREQRRMGRYEE